MFSWCVKVRKILLFIISIIVIFSIALLVLCGVKQKKELSPENYLKSFGYEIEFVREKQINIPQNFSKNLQTYNNLQLEQGFDLSKFCGKTCIQKQYLVKPKSAKEDEEYIANLLIYENKLIGGDIHGKAAGSEAMKLDCFSSEK